LRVILRSGTLGLGPDLPAGLVDVSEDGVCVQVKAPLKPGSDAEIVLDRVGTSRPMKLVADVRWCAGDPSGGYRAGLRLRRRLPYRELMDLARN
jgi:PilZ domain